MNFNRIFILIISENTLDREYGVIIFLIWLNLLNHQPYVYLQYSNLTLPATVHVTLGSKYNGNGYLIWIVLPWLFTYLLFSSLMNINVHLIQNYSVFILTKIWDYLRLHLNYSNPLYQLVMVYCSKQFNHFAHSFLIIIFQVVFIFII